MSDDYTPKDPFDDDWGLTDMFRAMDAELAPHEHPKAYVWIDKTYDNLWSKTVDRFDMALARFKREGDHKKMKEAVDYYTKFMVYHLKKYREAHEVDTKVQFLKSLSEIVEQFPMVREARAQVNEGKDIDF